LLNKEKLENAVLEQIQKQILTEGNVRKYIDLVMEQARLSKVEPTAEGKAVDRAITDVESKIRRWEDTLERGLLSPEESAHRIKELRQERAALLGRKIELEKKSRSAAAVSPIPTKLMDEYIRAMQVRLREKKIGYKKEFLKEILKEVRVRDKEITLTYKLPLPQRTPLPGGKNHRKEEFFTEDHLVELMGVEPTTSKLRI
jgi:hypothetical protein